MFLRSHQANCDCGAFALYLSVKSYHGKYNPAGLRAKGLGFLELPFKVSLKPASVRQLGVYMFECCRSWCSVSRRACRCLLGLGEKFSVELVSGKNLR